MVDAIRISLTPDTLTAQPSGDPVESVITIQNTGTAVDQYAVELDGLPTTWYNLSNTAVALFPQDKEEAKLVIRPPKGNGVKAGTYPFTVSVLSRADASQTSRAEGTLQVGAIAAFELDMSPKKVIGRKGRYKLAMRNGGNADVNVEFEAIDAEEELRYSFKPDTPQLAPGQRQTALLTVKPRRGGLVGARKNYDFQVKVKPSQGEPKTMQAQLVHTPRFRTWKPIRRTFFLALIIIILALIVNGLGGIDGTGTQLNRWRYDAAGFTCSKVRLFCGVHLPANLKLPNGKTGEKGNPNAHYIAGFRDFHNVAPDLLGQPLDDEQRNGESYAVQKTTNGTLLFDAPSKDMFFVTKDHKIYVFEFKLGLVRQVP